MAFICVLCGKTFRGNDVLRRHYRQLHPTLQQPQCLKPRVTSSQMSKRYICGVCQKTYKYNYDLRKHVRLQHQDAQLPEALTCGRKRKNLLKQRRKRPISQRAAMEKLCFTFNNMQEFSEWKALEEDSKMSRFVKKTERKNASGSVRKVYNCHRSGKYTARGAGKRHIKVQGSRKIGKYCPASIYVSVSASGAVTADYFPEHRGHETDANHLFLRKEQREQIAQMLAMGMSFDDVLDHVQMSAGSRLTALHFLTKADLKNVTRDFGLRRGVRLHKNDGESVAAWVESTESATQHASSESEAILANIYPSTSNECKTKRLEYIREMMSVILTDVEQHPEEMADVAFEHVTRLAAVIEAIKKKPTKPSVLPSSTSEEPANKRHRAQTA